MLKKYVFLLFVSLFFASTVHSSEIMIGVTSFSDSKSESYELDIIDFVYPCNYEWQLPPFCY